MSTALLTRPEALIAQWRTSGDDNPAGPLFSSPFTEADLTISITAGTNISVCTGSRTIDCC
ncbi:MAG: DUF6229 family protein [Jatrophihabitantaceae bacterium]